MKEYTLLLLLTIVLLLVGNSVHAQKKKMEISDFEIWNTIQGASVSPNGSYVLYSLYKGEKDHYLKIKNDDGTIILEHNRASNGKFTYNSGFALFTVKAWTDSLKDMRRRKVKKKELPKDTLAIFNLSSAELIKIPRVKSHKLPSRWSGLVAYQLEEKLKEKPKADSTKVEDKLGSDTLKLEEKKPKTKKPRPVNKENGYHLVIRDLQSGKQDTVKYVSDYQFSKEGERMVIATTGQDTTFNAQVMVYDYTNKQFKVVFEGYKAKFNKLGISDAGNQIAFVTDLDTTKILIRPNELYRWSTGMDQSKMIANKDNIESELVVSPHYNLKFSKDETKLFFGLASKPIVQDTLLLEEEIVNVEVWTYNEPRLYTVQKIQVKNDREKAFSHVFHIENEHIVRLANEAFPNTTFGNEGNATYALLSTSEPHELTSQWDGLWAEDFALVNTLNGQKEQILTKNSGYAQLSPLGEYVYGYSRLDSSWFVYGIADKKLKMLTKGMTFYNELHDTPVVPYPYGAAGWTEEDASLIIYDRYDMWEFNAKSGKGTRLTKGRESKIRFRYNKLDPDERSMPVKSKWLLSTFSEDSKNSGFYQYSYKAKKGKTLVKGPFRYVAKSKALKADRMLITRESFIEFPDLQLVGLDLKNPVTISKANPQQQDYQWGNIEIVKWTSLDGIELEGMLVKPDNFDPTKKYPLLVNFYERSSDGLNRHRTPAAGRSTINYSYYVSRGYVIFNPNIHYKTGYPGENAYNCVIPGVTKLIEQGFIDKERIGVQGHSWGGYQIAYLVTRTNIFKAAEAGAPVPNMISAYGGIRWDTGLSRQFQYEHTQSRIGGTPWQFPSRYVENSPIFYLDKVNTPLLIMHNDADGHVPWYQGIELFMSLRRLGKPSWFLNYNGEPHWPLKKQNRVDFNIRLSQFFDYYLMGAPMPVWMNSGVPAIKKGIDQGYEATDKYDKD